MNPRSDSIFQVDRSPQKYIDYSVVRTDILITVTGPQSTSAFYVQSLNKGHLVI